ncbi:hypothetical protein [Rugamonas rivuli]|uniref:Uncharacterized protein n=1 Tax=Rugamonas rivuli TaxID=2743358 RepID=A0A843SRS4_9BURK|nr:hypothetical protein [Rugamonas rivuli]MQA23657.1 hypothetical protein [Rugamonas rivuli]
MFWSNLKNINAQTITNVRLMGELGNPQNRKSAHRGAQELVAITAGNTVDIYSKKEDPGTRVRDQQTVYWLPWSGSPGKGQITEATWETIEKTGCNYFLTSEFTGCRFVVDDIGVSHVAYGAGNAVAGATNSAQRDAAEGNSRLQRSGRRKMSVSAGAGTALAYDINGYAVVFGYKDASSRWAFRVFRVDALGMVTWRNF